MRKHSNGAARLIARLQGAGRPGRQNLVTERGELLKRRPTVQGRAFDDWPLLQGQVSHAFTGLVNLPLDCKAMAVFSSDNAPAHQPRAAPAAVGSGAMAGRSVITRVTVQRINPRS